MVEKVYRNISAPVYIFGLELSDLLLLAVFFVLIFNVSDHIFINAMLLVGFYLAVRVFKKGKPQGYLLHLMKFLTSPETREVGLESFPKEEDHGDPPGGH